MYLDLYQKNLLARTHICSIVSGSIMPVLTVTVIYLQMTRKMQVKPADTENKEGEFYIRLSSHYWKGHVKL